MRFGRSFADRVRRSMGLPTRDEARLRAILSRGFDPAGYLASNADVRNAGADPIRHVITHGLGESRLTKMGMLDRNRYARGSDPLVSDRELLLSEGALHLTDTHARRSALVATGGEAGGTRTLAAEEAILSAAISEHLDPAAYLRAFPDLAKAGVNPLTHAVKTGAAANRLSRMGLLDRSRYKRGDDRTVSDRQLILEAGRLLVVETDKDEAAIRRVRELCTLLGIPDSESLGRGMSNLVIPMFDAEAYRARHGLGEKLTATELLTRYVMFDFPRGESPGLFDAEHYEAELAREGLRLEPTMTPFQHWLKVGVPRQISPTPLFDADEYLALNPELSSYKSWLFEHWILFGVNEGRRFDPNISVAPQRSFAPHKGRGLTDFVKMAARTPGYTAALGEMRAFRKSDLFAELVDDAAGIDPNIRSVAPKLNSLLPPLHDERYSSYLRVLELLPEGPFDAVVLIPFCKVGGADFVAGLLAKSLVRLGARTLVLRTDDAAFDRPDWFPENVATADLSDAIAAMPEPVRIRALYEVIRATGARVTINVNSRLAFKTFEVFGGRLKRITDLYCYYFCADRTPDGQETGYPVWYFAPILADLEGALVDTKYLADILTERHALPPAHAEKLKVLYTPATHAAPEVSAAETAEADGQKRKRPRILWAGRFDRQKRFDFMVDIARAMPDVDFDAWGKAVLDKPPRLDNLPRNLTIHPPFKTFDELPFTEADGWLYTSAWDGMPTILIEIANLGLAVAASSAGGVPELIDEATGWPIAPEADPEEAAEVLRAMLADRTERLARVERLRARVQQRHNRKSYEDVVASMLTTANIPVLSD